VLEVERSFCAFQAAGGDSIFKVRWRRLDQGKVEAVWDLVA